jgi:hypothetical protein
VLVVNKLYKSKKKQTTEQDLERKVDGIRQYVSARFGRPPLKVVALQLDADVSIEQFPAEAMTLRVAHSFAALMRDTETAKGRIDFIRNALSRQRALAEKRMKFTKDAFLYGWALPCALVLEEAGKVAALWNEGEYFEAILQGAYTGAAGILAVPGTVVTGAIGTAIAAGTVIPEGVHDLVVGIRAAVSEEDRQFLKDNARNVARLWGRIERVRRFYSQQKGQDAKK